MAFIRAKVVKGKAYYQLIETYREDGRVRQRVLAHLGRDSTFEAAIETYERRLGWAREYEGRLRKEAEGMFGPLYRAVHPEIPQPYPGCRRSLRSYWNRIRQADAQVHSVQFLARKVDKLRSAQQRLPGDTMLGTTRHRSGQQCPVDARMLGTTVGDREC